MSMDHSGTARGAPTPGRRVADIITGCMPIDRDRFDRIKAKYWNVASWAVWAEPDEGAKSKVGDLSPLNPIYNTRLLDQLNPNVAFVGLNISRSVILQPFANFHDARSQATDYKIRFAFRESPFWGGYMTDIIKDFEEKSSGKLKTYLRKHPAFERENVCSFLGELSELGTVAPTLIAFGREVHSILKRNFAHTHRILKVRHYAAYMSKEDYREEVRRIWSRDAAHQRPR
jgi:hypothetical protein